ncbi:NYN domain-containing protein [Algoriphagus sp.]|uniref:NYN domain-containing protein n=1 Tax=Algoriphagus sp. TaxID=1872435 RepID=UPI00260168D7|nr:NYN domain-containing protein [Algoriphagus sp.]
MKRKTAILVDGGFFLKRYRALNKIKSPDPVKTAKDLWEMCLKHLSQAKSETYDLYRIFYYDCLPYEKKQHNPITGKSIDFSKTEQYKFQIAFFEELKKKRKIALRLGILEDRKRWIIRPSKTKELLSGLIEVKDLSEEDVQFDFSQKMVDIKIGLDIASITLKGQVDQIILISGDSDFVPAAKLARREGIDFLLDPMWNPIKPHLFEHIDGLVSKIKKPTY